MRIVISNSSWDWLDINPNTYDSFVDILLRGYSHSLWSGNLICMNIKGNYRYIGHD